MAAQPRVTFKYVMTVGNKIVHRGITNDLGRRESEHRATWPDANIRQVGRRTTRDAGLQWERDGGKSK